jgi:hypothetical protein
MVVARVLEPGSKLATWRSLQPESATHSLSQGFCRNNDVAVKFGLH